MEPFDVLSITPYQEDLTFRATQNKFFRLRRNIAKILRQHDPDYDEMYWFICECDDIEDSRNDKEYFILLGKFANDM